jgi:hypothetical protein
MITAKVPGSTGVGVLWAGGGTTPGVESVGAVTGVEVEVVVVGTDVVVTWVVVGRVAGVVGGEVEVGREVSGAPVPQAAMTAAPASSRAARWPIWIGIGVPVSVAN